MLAPTEDMKPSPMRDGAYSAIIASTPVDRENAFKVRYSVYIQEQAKAYSAADHERKQLTDDLDATAAIILVADTKGPCGTVRANWAHSPDVKATYAHQFELSRFEQIHPRSISICSRLAVLRRCRGSRVGRMLFAEIYKYGLQNDTILCFAACAPALKPLFARYGFREYLPPHHDLAAGLLHRMVLVLDDIDYLEKIHSPFVVIAKELAVVGYARLWLNEIFAGNTHTGGAEETR